MNQTKIAPCHFCGSTENNEEFLKNIAIETWNGSANLKKSAANYGR